jgi:hypothetical protein
VRPQRRQLVGARFAVGQRGQDGLETLALGSGLDPRDAVQKCAPALG